MKVITHPARSRKFPQIDDFLESMVNRSSQAKSDVNPGLKEKSGKNESFTKFGCFFSQDTFRGMQAAWSFLPTTKGQCLVVVMLEYHHLSRSIPMPLTATNLGPDLTFSHSSMGF